MLAHVLSAGPLMTLHTFFPTRLYLHFICGLLLLLLQNIGCQWRQERGLPFAWRAHARLQHKHYKQNAGSRLGLLACYST